MAHPCNKETSNLPPSNLPNPIHQRPFQGSQMINLLYSNPTQFTSERPHHPVTTSLSTCQLNRQPPNYPAQQPFLMPNDPSGLQGIVREDSLVISAMKVLLHDVDEFSVQPLQYDEATNVILRFRAKYMMIMNGFIALANVIKSEADFKQVVEHNMVHISLGHERRSLSLTIGNCYLLKGLFEESFTIYENVLFSNTECLDPELWYILGILYDKVSYSLNL